MSAPLPPRRRVLPSNSPLRACGEPIRRRRGNHEGPCVTNRILVARRFGLDTHVFCIWNRRRTRTGLLRVGRHSRPLSSKRSRAKARGREFPHAGNCLAEANRRRSRHRLGRLVSDRPPVTVHLFAQSRYARNTMSHSIALRHIENQATLTLGAALRVPSSDPVRRTGRLYMADRENDATLCRESPRGSHARRSGCPATLRCARSIRVPRSAGRDQPGTVTRSNGTCRRPLPRRRC
jgi:hypothetical protein